MTVGCFLNFFIFVGVESPTYINFLFCLLFSSWIIRGVRKRSVIMMSLWNKIQQSLVLTLLRASLRRHKTQQMQFNKYVCYSFWISFNKYLFYNFNKIVIRQIRQMLFRDKFTRKQNSNSRRAFSYNFSRNSAYSQILWNSFFFRIKCLS